MSGMTIKRALAVIQTEVNWHAGSDTHYRAERLEQSLATLRAEIKWVKKAAERYQWLRTGNNDEIAVVRGLGAMDSGMSAVAYPYSEEIGGDGLDAAIDEAMAKEDGWAVSLGSRLN